MCQPLQSLPPPRRPPRPQGHITREDLVAYADKNGLPSLYASHFVGAVLQGQPAPAAAHGYGAGADEAEREREVTFAMFRNFVRSREEGLKRAFTLFDRGGCALERGVLARGRAAGGRRSMLPC